MEAIRERKIAHRLAVIDKSYSFTANQKTVLRTVPLRSTRRGSNRRLRELSWLAAGHTVHLSGSTAGSLLNPSILW